MRTASSVQRSSATEISRHDRRGDDISDGDVLTHIAKHMLWLDKTAEHLAAACGCSVRQAERYLGGAEWSGDAVAAVIAEILERRRMRNVKVRGRQ